MKRMKPDPNAPELTCHNGDRWPPIHAKVFGPNPEDSRGQVSTEDYERLRYWKMGCGLLTMEADKCRTCPHVLIHGKRVNDPAPKVKAAPSNRNVTKT